MWMAVVVALKSFNNHAEGDTLIIELTEPWAHLIANDYLRLVHRWPLDTPSDFTTSRSESSPSKPDDD